MDHVRFRQELNTALYDWNTAQEKAKKLCALPNFLLSFYTKTILNISVVPTMPLSKNSLTFILIPLQDFVYYLPTGEATLTPGLPSIQLTNLSAFYQNSFPLQKSTF